MSTPRLRRGSSGTGPPLVASRAPFGPRPPAGIAQLGAALIASPTSTI
jgi:hypothetical protein